MSTALRRMVVLGPAGTLYPNSSQDYTRASNRAFTLDTKTRWIRIWADWPTLMPARGQWNAERLANLDAQITQARRDGRTIVLTLFRFAPWANGTAAMTPEQLAATMPDRRSPNQSDANAKTLLMRYPDDVGPAGDWADFVRTLATRYSRSKTTTMSIDWLELANEPNLTWWPQQGPSPTANPYDHGTTVIHRVVAQMFKTAQAISASLNGEPGIMGSGTSDGTGTNRLKTGYDDFTDLLLAELAAQKVKVTRRVAWSHHNYTDVTYDQGPNSTAPDAATEPTRQINRAADVRRRIVGKFSGWPNGTVAAPAVFLTEGGVTLKNIAARYGIADAVGQRAKQADLIRRNWARMATDSGDGAGISLVSNYLFYTDPNFDCGLCDTLEAGGAKRPAYNAWRALPPGP